MCRRENTEEKCQKPAELKGKIEECSPEQIRKCHGEVKDHPCLYPEKKS